MRRETLIPFLIICMVPALNAACVTEAEGHPANLEQREGVETMLDFYRAQSVWTDPGEHLAMYEGVPDDIGGVVEAAQNVLVHGGLLWLYEISPTEQQGGGMGIRRTEELLGRIAQLKPGSLGVPRTGNERRAVNCRQ